jgi:tetratricopeptide (TPR) repeat protein
LGILFRWGGSVTFDLVGTLPHTRNAYNQPDVHTFHSFRLFRVGRIAASVGLGLLFAFSVGTVAGAQADSSAGQADTGAGRGRILLVLPFDNRSGQPSLDWIREASADILGSRFNSAGFAPMSRPERLYALDHLGLPQGFQPSRASSLKLAETLDADSIVVGSFQTDGTAIIAEARLVDVPHLRMGEAVTERGELRDLVSIFDSLAWKLTRELEPGFSVPEETFVAAGRGMRLDAFEQYIRGIMEPDQQERLRHLKQAVALSPDLGPAWMALGRDDYAGQKYDEAATAFGKVGGNGPDALEAGFYRGLSLLFSGDYPRAEESFARVAKALPLPAVVNNEGVALSRRRKDASALFRQAVAGDPTAADYHFNLAVSLKRKGDGPEALSEMGQCLRLRPSDGEADDLLAAWKAQTGAQGASTADPLERIVRSFDAVAFRQAAQMIDQVEASRLAALGPHERAVRLAAQARDFLDRGLLLEAERGFQSAIAADSKVAEAHEGLAELRERTGDSAAARKEASTALELLPSARAYLVLARLDLAAGHVEQAAGEADAALGIDPKSPEAMAVRKQIEARTGQK